ncbi:MAG: sensor histidine kinase [Anaerorhabdus sp.]
MKMNITKRLIISYAVLSLILILSLLVASNYVLEDQFNKYSIEKQDEKNNSLVQSVLDEISKESPSLDALTILGETALNDGVILMVNDSAGGMMFCMSCQEYDRCDMMLSTMEETMQERYPNFVGEYTEKEYTLEKNGVHYGTVVLGYYGPYYYSDADIQLLEAMNKMLLLISLLFVIVAIFIGTLMARNIAKPVKEIIRRTKEIEKGNYENDDEFKNKTEELECLMESVKSLASSLKTQQDLKKRMAADYAHEFRTPLAAIQSNLEGIIDGVVEPTEDRVESMRQEILRLSRMVSELDKITEIQSNQLELKTEKLDLKKETQVVVRMFDGQLKDKKIKLEEQFESCLIVADRDKVKSVVTNLLSNAIKYTKPHGIISVATRQEGQWGMIIVQDTGEGIPSGDLPYIFDHLYRADVSRARNSGGSGIGLSVVKAIVEAHHGRIEVSSKVGKGSLFVVKFPS